MGETGRRPPRSKSKDGVRQPRSHEEARGRKQDQTNNEQRNRDPGEDGCRWRGEGPASHGHAEAYRDALDRERTVVDTLPACRTYDHCGIIRPERCDRRRTS